jgi:hypothetical protein
MAVPAGFGPRLRKAWVTAHPGGLSISSSQVRSTLSGSVFYAAQPSAGAYWAISSFVPSAQAQAQAEVQGNATRSSGKALLAQFSRVAVFFRTVGHGWTYLGSSARGSCPSDVPRPVYSAWGICNSSLLATVGS